MRTHALAIAALLVLGATRSAAETDPPTLPALFPAPVAARLTGGALALGHEAVLVEAGAIDAPTLDLLRSALAAVGVDHLRVARHRPAVRAAAKAAPLVVTAGLASDPVVRDALSALGSTPPTAREGYALASGMTAGGARIVLAGQDADGLFYAAQTLAQIARRGSMPALAVEDQPATPIRGTIEGFYGAPWSMRDRLAHIRFLGSVKANTYVYSPKDDPYARSRWREPYPRAEFAALRTLVDGARRSHVRFTYAISPGPSICYSDPADIASLQRKIEAFRAIGVRSFYIAFDDIEYTKWNCDRDRAALGAPGDRAAGLAQAGLTNRIYHWLAEKDGAEAELMIVPTEYYNTTESPYKAALRTVDPHIYVQWTGTDVVPPSIAIRDASAAAKAFGRKALLWDNYPVNDYGESTGRLLMAPYRGREPGLAEALSGILANPMNQEAPSRVAVSGAAAFAWNDKDYDPDQSWRAAARSLANGDEAVTRALLTFFDLEHLAPTFGSQPWQPQAPGLKQSLDVVVDRLANGNRDERQKALVMLRSTADDIAGASGRIRSGVTDPGFIEQTAPWLDAMQLWGRALQRTAAGLAAAEQGNPSARDLYREAAAIAQQAGAIHTIAGTTRPQGMIALGDGVLDRFIRIAPGLIAIPATPTGSPSPSHH